MRISYDKEDQITQNIYPL